MALFTTEEREFAQAIAGLSYCNPFLPERIEAERRALGEAFHERPQVLSKRDELGDEHHPNIPRVTARVNELLERLRPRAAALLAAHPDGEEARLYADLVLFLLYHQFLRELDGLTAAPVAPRRVGLYEPFLRRLDHFMHGRVGPAEAAHRFALLFQVRRAFRNIFDCIIGESMPAARLRAAVWQSTFTHDMRRYRRVLYDRMGDVTCLVTGPSGTGKELVAKAVALSRYIPFDPREQAFTEDFRALFFPLNLSALSPTLIEGELFGHKRGAFTGATADRAGWLEVCPARGTVFLDEIGELEGGLQVKLLRVLQARSFQRVGETRERIFRGKIIAATNRDLSCEIRAGRFREDLYYRLCADTIVTPSLREQLADSPEALATLVSHIAVRLVGEEEAPALAGEVAAWVRANLAPDYPWPGNVRELEQCVRNVMIRGSYRPRSCGGEANGAPSAALAAELAEGRLSAEELLAHYTALVYARCGSYQETARRLQVDHRTVKSRLREELVARYRGGGEKGSEPYN